MYDVLNLSLSPLLAQFSLVQLWQSVWPYLMMLLGFSVIVFVHELGHFAVAKWADVKVERFSIGFGRELLGFTRGETRYSFNILPLGGYVKMLGQEDFDEQTDEIIFSKDPRSFLNKPVGHRMAIVSAGVIMNILFTIFLFMIVFWVGMTAIGTRVAYVDPDSPAERAGFLPGDDIKEVNGAPIRAWDEVKMAVVLSSPDENIEFTVERGNGELRRLYVRPESGEENDLLRIGVLPGRTRKIMVVGPEISSASETWNPRVGDVLIEVDGQPITDENVNQMHLLLGYTEGEVYVERKDPKDPEKSQRVRVNIPPIIQFFSSDPAHEASGNLLGLTPLVRFAAVQPKGRAALAGIEVGDTVLSWDDTPYPTMSQMARGIRYNPDRDMEFKVRKTNGLILSGFIRPKVNKKGAGTLQALTQIIPDPAEDAEDAEDAEGAPRARFAIVKKGGVADAAGVEVGDIVIRYGGSKNFPTVADINRKTRENVGERLSLLVEKPDGTRLSTVVVPRAPGSIQASHPLVAHDLMRVGRVVPEIGGRISPAAKARIPVGAVIVSVDDEPVGGWRRLIGIFADKAGTTVKLSYNDASDVTHTVDFEIPHTLHTMLDVGPEARIVRINGNEEVDVTTARASGPVAVGYHEGIRASLSGLIGQNVAVDFRRNLLSELETLHIDVTADMVDPWLGRVNLIPNIEVGVEMTKLKGENALDAIAIGVRKTYYFVVQVYQIIHRMAVTKTLGVENMSGPLGIIALGGKVAKSGMIEFLFFMAILSANLAVINFLPMPIVDGGLMVFLIIEKIKGSPVSLRIQVATQMVGLFLIISAFIFVTFQDVIKLMG